MEGRIYAAPTEEPQEGYGVGFRRGEGTPPYAWIFKWGCRAASPLAAVEVSGGGKVPGRDESLPYGLNRERDLAVGCGPHICGPYRGTARGIRRWVSAG